MDAYDAVNHGRARETTDTYIHDAQDAEAAPDAGKKQRGAWSMGGKHAHLAPELKEVVIAT